LAYITGSMGGNHNIFSTLEIICWYAHKSNTSKFCGSLFPLKMLRKLLYTKLTRLLPLAGLNILSIRSRPTDG